MFKINSNVNLNFKNFMIIITIIIILVILYNKAFIDSNYVSVDKYKNTIKKYKNLIESYMTKINELDKYIENQNKIINHLNSNFNGQVQQIGTHTSAHNASLTPSKFNQNNNINNNLSTPINELLTNNSLNLQISNRQLSNPLQTINNFQMRQNN